VVSGTQTGDRRRTKSPQASAQPATPETERETEGKRKGRTSRRRTYTREGLNRIQGDLGVSEAVDSTLANSWLNSSSDERADFKASGAQEIISSRFLSPAAPKSGSQPAGPLAASSKAQSAKSGPCAPSMRRK